MVHFPCISIDTFLIWNFRQLDSSAKIAHKQFSCSQRNDKYLSHEPQLKSWTVKSRQSFFNFTLKWGTPKMATFSSQIRNKKTNLDIPHISVIYCICLEDVIERTLPKHMSLLEKKHVMEMSMKYPWLYLVLQLKFHIAPIATRQIDLMSIMLNSNCKNPLLCFDPFTLLTTLKKPDARKIWPISLVLECKHCNFYVGISAIS
jgi:hypothetical protein